jgi:hypothetical protein
MLLIRGLNLTSISKKEAREHIENIGRISDERVRYFYMMLGSALADALAESHPISTRGGMPANASSQHLQNIGKRMTS